MNIQLTREQALEFAQALNNAEHGAVVSVFETLLADADGTEKRMVVYTLSENSTIEAKRAIYAIGK
jgi:hypothetical protein